ncbi:MAG: c-type cytochrome [Gammaproteobacteria bacterium]
MGGAVNLAFAGGDAAAGQAKSAVCGACHGADGNSMVPNFPKLAGQGEAYLLKQLQDIKSGAREVPEMMAITPGLSDQDMADLAAFYASQKPTGGAADPALVELGQQVYRGGNATTGVPACASCHGATGRGMPEAGFPALAGQHAAYIETQLKAFRAAGREDAEGKRRTNDGDTKMMRATAARLSDKEIKALASYINGLQ